MTRDFFKNYVWPIATLSGGIIGVGFLSLPYVALQVGIGWMLIYFAIFTALITWIHVMFGEIALHTPDFKRFPGFVGFYFGKTAEAVTFFLIIIGSYGTLLAYLIVGSQFLTTLLGVREMLWVGQMSLAHLFSPARQTGVAGALLASGPILFSLWGTGMIPQTEERVRDNKKSLRNIIIAGTVIPAVLYALFMVVVLAITGEGTTPSALMGPAVVLGFLTTVTAFVVQGYILYQTFLYDLGMGRILAYGAAFLPPAILFVLGVTQFIPVISFIGSFLLPIDALLIIAMYIKVKQKLS